MRDYMPLTAFSSGSGTAGHKYMLKDIPKPSYDHMSGQLEASTVNS